MSENDCLTALQMYFEGQKISVIAESLNSTPSLVRAVLVGKFGVPL